MMRKLGLEQIDSGRIKGIGFGSGSFVSLSLDDGVSWRAENLSNSAHLSSFTLANGHEYPGFFPH